MFARLHIARALPYVALCAGATFAAGGGWAIAASGGGVIHACSAKNGGWLRIATTCTKGERSISWNQLGPQARAATKLWFAVNANGKVVASSGLASTKHVHAGTGLYSLRFTRRVEGVCAPVVSLGTNDDVVAAPGEIATNFVFSPSSGLSVRTFDNTGVPVDQPFHGAVFC
jgi:hypothetical protein